MKRLIRMNAEYDKVVDGNLIALEVGMDAIQSSCPRFKQWITHLIGMCG